MAALQEKQNYPIRAEGEEMYTYQIVLHVYLLPQSFLFTLGCIPPSSI